MNGSFWIYSSCICNVVVLSSARQCPFIWPYLWIMRRAVWPMIVPGWRMLRYGRLIPAVSLLSCWVSFWGNWCRMGLIRGLCILRITCGILLERYNWCFPIVNSTVVRCVRPVHLSKFARNAFYRMQGWWQWDLNKGSKSMVNLWLLIFWVWIQWWLLIKSDRPIGVACN